jgi:hypothetical protein
LSSIVGGSLPIVLGMSSVLRGRAAFTVTGIVVIDVQKSLQVSRFGTFVRSDVASSSFLVSPIAVSQDLARLVSLGDAAFVAIVVAGLVRRGIWGPSAT